MTPEPAKPKRTPRIDPILILLVVLALPALAPLFAPGYFYSAHDGRHSVFFLMQFDASIKDGALFPRWAMHHIQGYGYPTFIIQAPLGFYLGEVFVLLGAGYTLAAKFTWVAGFLAGAVGIYILTCYWLSLYSQERSDRPQSDHPEKRPIQHRLAALAAGLLYVYVPYHLLDIYVRAALNDSLLLAWFPWVFLVFDRLIDRGFARGWSTRLALAIVTLGGVLLTHTFALLSFTPLLITFVLFRLWQCWRLDVWHGGTKESWRALIGRTALAALAGLLGLLLIAAFLLPLLQEGGHLEQQVYVTDTYNYRNHFVWFGQFFSPFWGFGYSDDPAGANDGMSFQLGLMATLFLLTSFFALRRMRGRPGALRFRNGLIAYLAAATLVTLFLMMPASEAIWAAVPPLGLIQFPWRLLGLTAFTTSALGGMVTAVLLQENDETPIVSRVQPTAAALVISLLVLFASYAYVQADLQPVEPWREDGRAVFRFEEEHPDMIAYTEWVQEPFTSSPMSAEYADPAYVEDYAEDGFLTRLEIVEGAGSILSQYSRGSSGGGVVDMLEPGTVRINELYFPGWTVKVDGEIAPFTVSQPRGLIDVNVSAGEHSIDARMGATPARTTGAIVSWSVLIAVALLLIWSLWRGGRAEVG